MILTESQLAALEKAKADKEAHGEFETECPGYCGAQDTFYVGTLKGVGRVYQQTFIDTYAKVGFAKLYDRKTPITAADLLNDRVIPFYEEHGVAAAARSDRSRHRILRQSRAPRIRTLSRGREHRPHPHQGQEPADQRHRRALPQDHARRVLSHRLPQEDLCDDRRAADRSRRLDDANTTKCDRIRAAIASARRRCKPSLTRCHWRAKNQVSFRPSRRATPPETTSANSRRLSDQVSTCTLYMRSLRQVFSCVVSSLGLARIDGSFRRPAFEPASTFRGDAGTDPSGGAMY